MDIHVDQQPESTSNFTANTLTIPIKRFNPIFSD